MAQVKITEKPVSQTPEADMYLLVSQTPSGAEEQDVRRLSPEAMLAKYFWTGTQAEYDALESYDSNTTYYIVEASS